MKYAIVIEPTDTGFSAYCPDLPGCVSTGASRSAIESNMREAISLHLEGLRAEGLPMPAPSSEVDLLDVSE
jgi:predicted RNase H-like HicB family nuclease